MRCYAMAASITELKKLKRKLLKPEFQAKDNIKKIKHGVINKRPLNYVRKKAIEWIKSSKISEPLSIEIEAALFKHFKSISKEYKAKLRSLKFNLTKNDEIRSRVEAKDIMPSDLVMFTADELISKSVKNKREEAQSVIFNESRSDWFDKNRDKVNKVAGIKSDVGLFKCFRCKSTKTTHYQKQTRCADEPMTVFIQCTSCGNRWRR